VSVRQTRWCAKKIYDVAAGRDVPVSSQSEHFAPAQHAKEFQQWPIYWHEAQSVTGSQTIRDWFADDKHNRKGAAAEAAPQGW
jgi:hypothetical protein